VEREATGIGPEELGLTLADGKTVLKQVQARIVQIQIEAISAAAKACRELRPEPEKGPTQPAAADGLWRGGCVLSPVRAVHLPGRQTSSRVAAAWNGGEADLAGAELPAREMGQHHALSTSGATVERVPAAVGPQNVSGDSEAPHPRRRRAARPAGDRARRMRLARFAPTPCTAR
jgi:hypothetical protein